MAITCAECHAEPRMRYPGGDPENGPAARRCKCASAQLDPMWRGEPVAEYGWPLHPDDCDCDGCAYDRAYAAHRKQSCQHITGGKHHWIYTRDGDGETGPMPGGEIVCDICGTLKEDA